MLRSMGSHGVGYAGRDWGQEEKGTEDETRPGRSRLRECGRRDWRLAGLSSALAFPLEKLKKILHWEMAESCGHTTVTGGVSQNCSDSRRLARGLQRSSPTTVRAC